MKCSLCDKKAVFENPVLCKDHFIKYVEKKVFETIKKYSMYPVGFKEEFFDDLENSKSFFKTPLVATSGGKDSIMTLYLVKKFFGTAEALLIDEGIDNYRSNTILDLISFCKKYDINYKIVSFKDEVGYTLDEILDKLNEKPCSVCGVLRRYFLNKYSLENGVIYLGHNLDDEAQAIFMNYLTNRIDLLSRLGPVSGVSLNDKFSKRFKPLYFIPEKQVMLYVILKGFDVKFNECPYVHDSFRSKIRDGLNKLEVNKVGSKLNIINSFLLIKDKLVKTNKIEKKYCSVCGFPSTSDVCAKCLLMKKL